MGITFTNYSENTFSNTSNGVKAGSELFCERRRFIELMKNKHFGEYEYTLIDKI